MSPFSSFESLVCYIYTVWNIMPSNNDLVIYSRDKKLSDNKQNHKQGHNIQKEIKQQKNNLHLMSF